MREDETYVARVPKADADKVRLRQGWVSLLSLQVTSLGQQPVFRLEVHRGGERRFVYKKGGIGWHAEGDQEEDTKVDELVQDHLKSLRARQALKTPEGLSEPTVLKLIRTADGADLLLQVRAWLRDDRVLVAGDLPGVVYEVNCLVLKKLLAERWQ